MKTAATEMLGIEFPIFAFSHCRDVVAAVSRAGGRWLELVHAYWETGDPYLLETASFTADSYGLIIKQVCVNFSA